MNPYNPPGARVGDAARSGDPGSFAKRPGLITQIGILYLILGVGLSLLALLGVRVGGYRLLPWEAVTPALLAISGVGSILRRKWGRWSSYFFSTILLVGIPIGTVVGGLMIYHLTIYRDQFNHEAQTVSPD